MNIHAFIYDYVIDMNQMCYCLTLTVIQTTTIWVFPLPIYGRECAVLWYLKCHAITYSDNHIVYLGSNCWKIILIFTITKYVGEKWLCAIVVFDHNIENDYVK